MSKQLKPYFVEYTVTAVVMAEDETHAFMRAKSYRQDAMNDADDIDVFVRSEVKSEVDLIDGWDMECIPYGGDGNTRIGKYLEQAAETEATK